jgi:protein O-mannosyl-transferase
MTEPRTRQPHPLLIALCIAAFSFIAYAHVGQCSFVNIDDDAYVQFQPLVNKGIRSAGIAFAFTGSHSSNWHPLTTLSHMLDCTMFGVKPTPMHWENLLWHTVNSVLVFFSWRALSSATWRSALIAAVFAVHPLHVESVAWISERKDVLHAFFWLLGLLAYAAYARAASRKNYALVALALVFALLSKPMAVTFPCTLLLLDFWPLRRWPDRRWRQLIIEKIPLFALVAVHSVLTFVVQRASGAANFGERFTLDARIGNALVAYARYLGKTFWPESLSPLYFHPGYWPSPTLIVALGVVVTVTILAWRHWRTRPWLAFGWLWFLGTLVPVLGLVQVGAQSMADRYMYVPILGVVTIVAWECAAAAALWPKVRGPLIAAAAAALVGSGVLTTRQVRAWENSITLLEHSIAVGEDNPGIRYLLAVAFSAAGRSETEVAEQFHRALALRPDYVNAITQLAAIAIAHGNFEQAQALVEKTVLLEPRNPGLRANLGALALRRGKPDEAIRHFEDVLRLDPKSSGAHFELGKIFLERQQYEQGRIHYEARARLASWDADAQCDYGTLLCNIGRFTESPPYLERAIWLNPDFERARQNLAAVRQALQAKGPLPPQIR